MPKKWKRDLRRQVRAERSAAAIGGGEVLELEGEGPPIDEIEESGAAGPDPTKPDGTQAASPSSAAAAAATPPTTTAVAAPSQG